MQIQFGTSSKRVNSTFIPAMSETYNCTLKRPCTVEHPVVDISVFNIHYNVAYIPDFQRFYFVEDIESISNSITRYHLTVDVLASFKQRILAHRLNIARSQSHGVKTLIDPLATHTAMTPEFYERTFDLVGADFNGTYILQTAGTGTTSSIGEGVNTYAVTASNLRSLINELFTASTYNESGQTTVAAAEKTYFNPMQYVIACRWIPIAIGGTESTIKFGWWDSGVTANLVQTATRGITSTVILPAAIDWTYTDSRYSRYFVTIPGFGNIEVDPAYAGHNINVNITVDIMTGTAKLKMFAVSNTTPAYVALIAQASGYWSVEVMLTQLSTDAAKLANNVWNTASSAITGKNFGDLLSGGLKGMQQASGTVDTAFQTATGVMGYIPYFGATFRDAVTSSVQPMLSMSGAVGNMSEFAIDTYVRLTVIHYDVLEADLDVMVGLPCNRNLLLSDLTGFTICNNASITIASASIKEKTAIKSYLEGGFWIE